MPSPRAVFAALATLFVLTAAPGASAAPAPSIISAAKPGPGAGRHLAFRFPAHHPGAYQAFNTFDRDVLGEDWVSHWGPNRRGATRGVIEPGAEGDPILRGVTGVFGDSGVYETNPVAGSKIVLRGHVLKGMKPDDPPDTYRKTRKADKQEQGINDPAMPIAWTRIHTPATGRPNRVFCTTMGAATDLLSEGLRRLVVNAVLWGFELEIPAGADVGFVDPFEPAPYAFKGYRRALTHDDHALGRKLSPGLPAPPAPRKNQTGG